VEGGEAIVGRALDAFGGVDVVINNAGIVRDKSFANMGPAAVAAVIDVHLRGAFNVTQPAYGVMKANGYGRLLFVTSAAGLFGSLGQANYAAAKMGLVGLARTVAIEGARYGVRANVIAPLARTPMTAGLFGGAMDAFDPEQVVPMAGYLVSEQYSVTGEIFSAGGGRFARAVIGVTHGWVCGDDRPAAEDIADNIQEIRADEEYVFPASATEEIELARSLV
jgi:NAD(P)-dependent dehydrogenase (short-subunit alcohol dehydrogenase family)